MPRDPEKHKAAMRRYYAKNAATLRARRRARYALQREQQLQQTTSINEGIPE